MVLWNTWRSIDLRAARQLIVASAVGSPFGLYILTDAPEALVLGILGVLLIAYGLYSLTRLELPTVTWSGWIYVLGFCAGLLGIQARKCTESRIRGPEAFRFQARFVSDNIVSCSIVLRILRDFRANGRPRQGVKRYREFYRMLSRC